MSKLKITRKVFAGVAGLLMAMQVSTYAATGKSTAVNVRVRETPSEQAEIIELLAMNDVVEILSKEGSWYKVNFNGKTGYVSQAFISTNEEIEENNSSEVNDVENGNVKQDGEDATVAETPQSNENTNTEAPQENAENKENTEAVEQPVEEENKEETMINKTYKVSVDSQLNILPLPISEHIASVKKDEDVMVVESAGSWLYVKSASTSGWIRIENLNVAEEVQKTDATAAAEKTEEEKVAEAQATEVAKQEVAYTPKNMYVKATAANVRSQSNTSSELVTAIVINTQVKVVGEENGWYKVEVEGKSGYIRSDLLSDKKTEVTARSNAVNRTATNAEKQNNATVAVTTEANASPKTTTTKVEDSSKVATTTPQATQNTESANNSAEPKSASGVTGTDIANYAQKFVGCRYVYGASGPNSFDCSGLVMYVYKHFGYSLSHSSKVQATQGRAVTGELQPGDILVFSNNGKTVGHVGIYIGNDRFVHAADSSTGVTIGKLSDRWNKSKYWGARRVL